MKRTLNSELADNDLTSMIARNRLKRAEKLDDFTKTLEEKYGQTKPRSKRAKEEISDNISAKKNK